MSIIDTASGGVSSAATKAEMTNAYRRWRARNCGVTRPRAARIVITSGSSATAPDATMNGTAIPKYRSIVIIGARSSRENPSNTFNAAGSSHS